MCNILNFQMILNYSLYQDVWKIFKITNIDQNTWVNTSIFDNNVLYLIVIFFFHNEKYDLITNIYVRPNITLTFFANNKDNPHCTFHSHDQLMDEQSFESLRTK